MMKEEASLGESGSVRPDLGFARMLWSLSSLGMCNIGLCHDTTYTTIPPLELGTLFLGVQTPPGYRSHHMAFCIPYPKTYYLQSFLPPISSFAGISR
jgi:hypothetical protein